MTQGKVKLLGDYYYPWQKRREVHVENHLLSRTIVQTGKFWNKVRAPRWLEYWAYFLRPSRLHHFILWECFLWLFTIVWIFNGSWRILYGSNCWKVGHQGLTTQQFELWTFCPIQLQLDGHESNKLNPKVFQISIKSLWMQRAESNIFKHKQYEAVLWCSSLKTCWCFTICSWRHKDLEQSIAVAIVR